MSETTLPHAPVHVPWVDRILGVLDHMHAHLDSDIDPVVLARQAGFSPHHFHRVFRGMTGESVMGHVRRLRLERAALQLKHGDAPVTAVALASGYGSHEAFTRAFRERFGVAPRDFRAQAGEADDVVVTLRREPLRRCIAVRHIGPYEEVGRAWEALFAYVGPAGLVRGVPRTLALVHDDPDITAPAQCRYDAALVLEPTVAVPAALPSGMTVRELPDGQWATTIHTGPFETIQRTYDALLGRALARRGVELVDEPTVEVTLDDPRTTPPAALRTEIQIRLA
jgi:AraC family transcriptional regulator